MEPKAQTNERRISALAVSRGIGVGPVVFFRGENRSPARIELGPSEIVREIERFQSAVAAAIDQLKTLSATEADEAEDAVSHILGIQLLILDGSPFAGNIESAIREQNVNAEWAIRAVANDHLRLQGSVPDKHLSEKRVDIEDVAERLLNALKGRANTTRPDRYAGAVVVARELRPSTLTELAKAKPNALITERGGWTSHTSIIAREFRLPMVSGVKDLEQTFADGDRVIVDGINGQVILEPENATIDNLPTFVLDGFHEPGSGGLESTSIVTLDGTHITLRANVDSVEAYVIASRLGVQSIGLYRSESLLKSGEMPSEDVQTAAYIQMADAAAESDLKIRTFDLGIDDLNGESGLTERNPSLGLRSLRLSLSDPIHFRTQIRAILRAAAGRNLDIVLPMVSGAADVDRALMLIGEEETRLGQEGVPVGDPQIGAMIEIPSAVLDIDAIARRVDFLCLGTNDLVQYLLAVDRDNDAVADWYQSLHPAVIRAISDVLSAAERANKPVQICGEMAGSAFYVPLLMGLGACELSMNVNSIKQVQHLISGIHLTACAELADSARRCETADETETLLRNYYLENWSDLFPPGLLNAKHR